MKTEVKKMIQQQGLIINEKITQKLLVLEGDCSSAGNNYFFNYWVEISPIFCFSQKVLG